MARRVWCLCGGWCAWVGGAVVLAGWQWRCHGGGGVAMVAGLWRRLLCCVGAVNMRAQTGPTQTDWLISMQFTVLARNRRHWGRRKGNRAGSCMRGYAPAPWCMHSANQIWVQHVGGGLAAMLACHRPGARILGQTPGAICPVGQSTMVSWCSMSGTCLAS